MHYFSLMRSSNVGRHLWILSSSSTLPMICLFAVSLVVCSILLPEEATIWNSSHQRFQWRTISLESHWFAVLMITRRLLERDLYNITKWYVVVAFWIVFSNWSKRTNITNTFQTVPLVDYYKKHGVHVAVDAAKPMTDVKAHIDQVFAKFTQKKVQNWTIYWRS